MWTFLGFCIIALLSRLGAFSNVSAGANGCAGCFITLVLIAVLGVVAYYLLPVAAIIFGIWIVISVLKAMMK
jgi:hypothetical protein